MIPYESHVLDYVAYKSGTYADWYPSVDPEREQELHDKIAQIGQHLSERDALVLDLIGRGRTQSEIARHLGVTQPVISYAYRQAVRRAKYWARLLDASSDVARALRELESPYSEWVMRWLTGTPTERAGVPQSTAHQRIDAVRRDAAIRGGRACSVLVEMIDRRREHTKV